MKQRKQSLPEFLDHCFARFRELPQSEVENACERVLEALREESGRTQVPAYDRARPRRKWRRIALSSVFAAFVLGVLVTEVQNSRQLATVIQINGSMNPLLEGQTLRTGDRVVTVLSFAGGSRIEVRQRSELSLQSADDGLRIHLQEGSIIVNTAVRTRRLYVQTKQLTVTAIGTVFLVTAEQAGSNVGVIQGVVRVQRGTIETTLTRAEQLATNPVMESGSLSEKISWSQNVETHLEQLQLSAMMIQERCGPTDLRSIVRENGGWSFRLPGVLWREYWCQREGDEQ
jgi:ferric-dicitrate binding protein FerR (iron transport regulator)